DALSAAHQADVVHRDLKPDNIMILENDQVKVLDFGISRVLSDVPPPALGEPAPDETGAAKAEKMVGTLRFMSPEQANRKDMGTASDIYSLGILFHELFSDTPAHPPGLDRDALIQRARTGQTEPVHGVPGDLARLIERMKEPVPAARPTASEAAAILQRIRSRPARRLRWAIAAMFVVVMALGALKYTLDLRHERAQAELARAEAVQVSEFLSGLFEVSDPDVSKGETITARELLEQGAARIDAELADQPRVLARLKLTIGSVYLKLGLYQRSGKQLSEAASLVQSLTPPNPELLAEIQLARGLLHYRQSEFPEAEKVILDGLEHLPAQDTGNVNLWVEAKALLGIVYARTERFTEALEMQNSALELLRSAGASDPKREVEAMNNIAQVYWRQEDLPNAEAAMRAALQRLEDSGVDALDLETTLNGNMANILGDMGQAKEASNFAETAVRIQQRIHGEHHPSLALAYDNLAVAMFRAGKLEEAEQWNLAALEVFAETVGSDHVDYAATLQNRGVILRNTNRLAESEAAFKEVLRIRLAAFGEVHISIAEVLRRQGVVFSLQGRHQEAAQAHGRALSIFDELDRPLTFSVVDTWRKLAGAHHEAGDTALGQATLQELLVRLEPEGADAQELRDEIQADLDAMKSAD
ncbi:MAG: tetratricopeptide repeat protein, partial [Xanthomonadales bacterium]|nr:tetratricopeptide repeat protein [Xanthomonadales bacterium]